MKFFIDSADIKEIQDWVSIGLVNSVTTNPTLMAKVIEQDPSKNYADILREICDIVPGPVSAEVTALDFDRMIQEAKVLTKIASNIAIKVPLTIDGLKACKYLTDHGHQVNVTLCFSAGQALLAAKAGATYISPFIGRLDDISQDGLELIQEIRDIYDSYASIETEILAASIRHPLHVTQAARIGADVATMPSGILKRLFQHPLTDLGIKAFEADWAKTGQSIL
jgi:transaldolase